jgi:hypothetical protein
MNERNWQFPVVQKLHRMFHLLRRLLSRLARNLKALSSHEQSKHTKENKPPKTRKKTREEETRNPATREETLPQ